MLTLATRSCSLQLMSWIVQLRSRISSHLSRTSNWQSLTNKPNKNYPYTLAIFAIRGSEGKEKRLRYRCILQDKSWCRINIDSEKIFVHSKKTPKHLSKKQCQTLIIWWQGAFWLWAQKCHPGIFIFVFKLLLSPTPHYHTTFLVHKVASYSDTAFMVHKVAIIPTMIS